MIIIKFIILLLVSYTVAFHDAPIVRAPFLTRVRATSKHAVIDITTINGRIVLNSTKYGNYFNINVIDNNNKNSLLNY